MKNILKNKILIILTIFAIILGFGSNVFASFDFTYNDIEYSLPDLPELDSPYFIIRNTYSSNGTAHVDFYVEFITSDINDFYIGRENYNDYYARSFNGNITASVYYIHDSQNEWDSPDYFSTSELGFSKNVVYSTFDLKDQNGNVVFQGAPQEQEQEETTILAPIVEQAETERVTEEIVGLLPLIVVLLVSIIAIYKAIRFLLSVLRTS